VLVGEELVDAAHAGIGHVLPPAAAAAHGHVRLDEADRLAAEQCEVAAHGRLAVVAGQPFAAQFGDAGRRLVAVPPRAHVRSREPLGE
jgi:hypothetical protein